MIEASVASIAGKKKGGTAVDEVILCFPYCTYWLCWQTASCFTRLQVGECTMDPINKTVCEIEVCAVYRLSQHALHG